MEDSSPPVKFRGIDPVAI